MNISIDARSPNIDNTIRNKATDPKEGELLARRKSCRDFEAIYVNEMYKSMRKSVPDSVMYKNDMANTLYQEMLDMEMAKQTSEGDGMGIGKAMYDQLKSQHFPD